MSVLVTDERPRDAAAIRTLVARAFRDAPYSDGREPEIVDALRASGELTFSLVAVQDGVVVGHLAASPATIGGQAGWAGIGPVAVAPDLQRRGIGSALVRAALERLRREGAAGAVLVGDPAFYGRLGFAPALGCHWRDIEPPSVQVASLSGSQPSGAVRYSPAFEALA